MVIYFNKMDFKERWVHCFAKMAWRSPFEGNLIKEDVHVGRMEEKYYRELLNRSVSLDVFMKASRKGAARYNLWKRALKNTTKVLKEDIGYLL